MHYNEIDSPLLKEINSKTLLHNCIIESRYWEDVSILYTGSSPNCKLFEPNSLEIIAAFGRKESQCSPTIPFHSFKPEESRKWWFGYLSYDLKNTFDALSSNNKSAIPWRDFSFIEPEIIIIKRFDEPPTILSKNENSNFTTDLLCPSMESSQGKRKGKTQQLNLELDKDRYINGIGRIKALIESGDVYEINYCMEYNLESTKMNPYSFFMDTIVENPVPFSAFVKTDGKFILSSSMERFLQKSGNRLISQPIKGTISRSEDFHEDELFKIQLKNNEKERAENLMIVDLVRNDLARVCHPGSVKVDELFGIYTFPTVHQMISTVSGQLKEDTSFHEIIKSTFPMGSMTGAPKIRAMEVIEDLEDFRRGIYAGSVGYITPEGDFDFNVIIRTVVYDEKSQKITLSVGSAITYDSVPEKEFEECQLKVNKLIRLLNEHLT